MTGGKFLRDVPVQLNNAGTPPELVARGDKIGASSDGVLQDYRGLASIY